MERIATTSRNFKLSTLGFAGALVINILWFIVFTVFVAPRHTYTTFWLQDSMAVSELIVLVILFIKRRSLFWGALAPFVFFFLLPYIALLFQ